MARPSIFSPAWWHPPVARPRNFLLNGPVSWRPPVIPVRAFGRPVSNIPLTGGQGSTLIGGSIIGPGIKIVQSLVIPGALSGSFAAGTTAGNCAVVAINAYSGTSGNVPNVTGVTLGGSADHFASAQQAVSGFVGTYSLAAIWVDPNCAGGQTAIAVSGANLSVAGPLGGITIYEVSGLTASPVDQVSGGNATSGTSWSSGATPTTTLAAEIWFGSAMTNNTITPPGAPWTSNTVATTGASGSQIVSAAGAATYAGTQSGSGTWAAVVVTLKGTNQPSGVSGQASISVGPQGLGNVWYPAQVTIKTDSGVNDTSTCSIFLGAAATPITLLGTIFPGGIGTLAAAVPPLCPGQALIAQWTGGNPGDVASINVIGTMDSVMPG